MPDPSRRSSFFSGLFAGAAITLAAIALYFELSGDQISSGPTVRDQAEAFIEENYFEEVTDEELESGSIRGMIDELRKEYDDRFSHYFDPKEFRQFQRSLGGRLQGRRPLDQGGSRGPRSDGGVPGLARGGRRHRRRRRDPRRRRQGPGWHSRRACDGEDQGQGRHGGGADDPAGRRRRHQGDPGRAGADHVPAAQGRIEHVDGRKVGYVLFCELRPGRPCGASLRDRSPLPRRRRGPHPRPARKRRRAPRRSHRLGVGLRRRWRHRHHARPYDRRGGLRRARRRDRPQAHGRPDRRWHRVRVGDPGRGDVRLRPGDPRWRDDLRQGNGPGVGPAARRLRDQPDRRRVLHVRGRFDRGRGHPARRRGQGRPRRPSATRPSTGRSRSWARSSLEGGTVRLVRRRCRQARAFPRRRAPVRAWRAACRSSAARCARTRGRWSSPRPARGASRRCGRSARRSVRATWSRRFCGRGWSAAGFSRRIEDEAREAPAAAGEVDPTRRDLRDLATFTVDPATARDFDDAVSAQPDGDGIRLWIHIADVSAHVRPGSALDSEAYRRATSVYVPGHGRADASRRALERGVQPGARPGSPGRHRRDAASTARERSARRASTAAASAPAHAWTTTSSTASSPGKERAARARRRAAGPRAQGGGGARRGAPARRARGGVVRARVRVRLRRRCRPRRTASRRRRLTS